jgi:hypothetical protein
LIRIRFDAGHLLLLLLLMFLAYFDRMKQLRPGKFKGTTLGSGPSADGKVFAVAAGDTHELGYVEICYCLNSRSCQRVLCISI